MDSEQVTPDAVLVPLVGFDSGGYRLGYGGGFFDRTLASMEKHPVTIGVGFELCRLESIFPQPHDIPMDFVVTEAGIHLVRGGRLDLVDEAASAEHARCVFAARRLPRAAPAEPGAQLSSPVCYAGEFPGYWGEDTDKKREE